MKHKKALRISGIALILALLLLAVPAAPALAFYDMSLSPSQGTVGTTVTVTGINFQLSDNSTTITMILYFSSQQMTAGQSLETVTKKKTVATPNTSATGTFTTSFIVPTKFDDNSNVMPGTHYLYACVSTTPNTIVFATTIPTFTVLSSAAIDPLSPASGPVGTAVVVSGSGFTASTAIVFKFDTTTITPTSGHTSTLSTGLFLSTITIPSATVGTHTISVTVGANTVSRTFTVTASAALDPLTPSSGPPGTDVSVVGANFPVSTAIVFRFDTTTILPKSGDSATRSNGIFISTITIPSTATAGAHAISATAGTSIASATFTVTAVASATLAPLSPASGTAGTEVTISGSSFPASTALVFRFDTTTITPTSGHTTTLSGGTFTSIITVPSAATTGTHTISATAGAGTASAVFTVTEPTAPPPPNTSLTIVPSGDHVGASSVIIGTGFNTGDNVTVTFDGVTILEDKVQDGGIVAVSPTVPTSKHGDHLIVIADQHGNSGNITFTVESVPPQIPAPLQPAMGAAIKASAVFDWADVSDNSSPVTYNLQIASSPSFTPDSIILQKTGLTQSQYMLSEAEQLKLASEVGTLYWREDAVDAAMNESDWSGAGSFSIERPFKFTGWPLYVTIGVGGVLVFLFGFWIGRRTAFYY